MDDVNRDTFEAAADMERHGVAGLFQAAELRRFVKGYLFFILMLEIFIFLVCFLCQLEPINIPFPWKSYFLGALLIPIAVTFLLGVFVTAFNLFLFRGEADAGGEGGADTEPPDGAGARLRRIGAAIHAIRYMPFLLSLLLLCVAIIAIVHLDTLFRLASRFSESVVVYLFWGFVVLVAGGTILAFVMMVSRYRLEKDRQRQEFRYRREMALRMGVVITEKHLAVRSGRATALLTETAGDPGEGEAFDDAPAAAAPEDRG
jgi:hypothetical protein